MKPKIEPGCYFRIDGNYGEEYNRIYDMLDEFDGESRRQNKASGWEYVGVNERGHIRHWDDPKDYGPNAKELFLKDFEYPINRPEAQEYLDASEKILNSTKTARYDKDGNHVIADEVNSPSHYASGEKPTNPKDAIGSTTKVPLSYLPIPPLMEAALGMFEGGCKYGRHNYRAAGVRASVYFDATIRHLFDYWEGEDFDPDSAAGLHHISKAISSLLVMRDSMIHGNFVDDRPPSISNRKWLSELNNKVPEIIEQHKDKSPKHWTIEDDKNA